MRLRLPIPAPAYKGRGHIDLSHERMSQIHDSVLHSPFMPLTCRINRRLGKLNMRSAAAACGGRGGREGGRKVGTSKGRSVLTSFGILVAEGQSVAAAAAKRKNCSFVRVIEIVAIAFSSVTARTPRNVCFDL